MGTYSTVYAYLWTVRNKAYTSSMKTPAEVVIAELGVRPLARSLGISPSTVLKWRERGGLVPSRYHLKILELSNNFLNADDLVHGSSHDQG